MGEGEEEDAERGKSSIERGGVKAELHKYVYGVPSPQG